jgi:hypothetical protein
MKKQGKSKGQVVGFYKDRGKTKPITKSVAQLNREKFVERAHRFKSVGVVARVRDTSQALEDLMGELSLAQDHLAVLNEQQKHLLAESKQSPVLDREIEKTKEQMALLRARIRGLGS